MTVVWVILVDSKALDPRSSFDSIHPTLFDMDESGFEEEFHIMPVAPQRTLVLFRQDLPRGPFLCTVTSIPCVLPLLRLVVKNWNYHIALEDSCVIQGKANRIDDWGSPRIGVGGLGDDLILRFW